MGKGRFGMNILIRFLKVGNVKYISHLDLQNHFIKALRRTSLHLNYSKGFNPHPHLVFAAPLSVGFQSNAEFLTAEVSLPFAETKSDFDFRDLRKKQAEEIPFDFFEKIRRDLDMFLPEGIIPLYIKEIKEKKSIAALAHAAEYIILLENANKEAIENYFKNGNIIIKKESKKTGKIKELSLNQNLLSLSIFEPEAEHLFLLNKTYDAYRFSDETKKKFLCLKIILKMNSDGTVSPADLIADIQRQTEISFDFYIMRNNIFLEKQGKLLSLDTIL
jgi:uncharacterized protein (DUF2344 family)